MINKKKYSRFNQTSLTETWNKKCFSIMQFIKFYSFDVKAIVTKKVACNIFWKHSQKKKNVIIEILSCDFDEMDQNFSKWILSQDFTSNTFEFHEQKTGGKQNV